jgi:uncharacterized phage-like protein YoqJ
MNKKSVCCFTGHRRFSTDEMEYIKKRLNDELDRLIELGVTNFISGGAFGFDQIAAIMVIAKRKRNADIRLILALPCRNHDKSWTSEERRIYGNLLSKADEVCYISEEYSEDCMKKRNFHMIDSSAYCICALLRNGSGTGQTVRYARQKGVDVINVANVAECGEK